MNIFMVREVQSALPTVGYGKPKIGTVGSTLRGAPVRMLVPTKAVSNIVQGEVS